MSLSFVRPIADWFDAPNGEVQERINIDCLGIQNSRSFRGGRKDLRLRYQVSDGLVCYFPTRRGNETLDQGRAYKALDYRIDGNLLVASAPDDKAEDQKE